MWVLFLQTREFCSGNMIRNDISSHLPAFHQLRLDILAGKEATNTSVPLTLLQDPNATRQPKKRKETHDKSDDEKQNSTDEKKHPKKTFVTHPMIKEKLGPVFIANPTASIKKMCELCDVKLAQLFPNHKRRCLLAALKGECSYANCKNKHDYVITDAEAQHICQLLDPVISDPTRLTRVS